MNSWRRSTTRKHLLLGLLARPDTIAGLALADLGLTRDAVQGAVNERCGMGAAMRDGHIPFTARMWRNGFAAAGPQHFRYIGPERLLLAPLKEPESTACQILAKAQMVMSLSYEAARDHHRSQAICPHHEGLNTPAVRSACAAVSKASAPVSRSSGSRWLMAREAHAVHQIVQPNLVTPFHGCRHFLEGVARLAEV